MKREVAKEEWSAPELGKVEKVGESAYFTFSFRVPAGKVKNMDQAKRLFNKHQRVLNRIVERYFYYFFQSDIHRECGRMIMLPKGSEIVESTMRRLGFIE